MTQVTQGISQKWNGGKKENHFREATGKRVGKSQHASITANMMEKSRCLVNLENVKWEAACHTQGISVCLFTKVA